MKLMTDNVPLRLTTVWQQFQKTQAIPHRYGLCSGQPLQYDQVNTLFVWADHAVESIDEVLVNKISVSNWTWYNGVDSTNHPVAFVEFNSAQDIGVEIIVKGKGKPHPLFGTRMTNPADIVWDLLSNICGNDVLYAKFNAFKTECERLGVQAGGSILDQTQSVQTTIRTLCQSIGGAYCADSKGLLRIWPNGRDQASKLIIDAKFDLTMQVDATAVINDLTVNFDFLDATAQQSIELASPVSIAKYGKKAATVDGRWLTDIRSAFDMATRYLQLYARPTWSITVDGIDRPLLVGDFVQFNHPLLLYRSPLMVLSRERNLSTDKTKIGVSLGSGAVPTLKLLKQSSAFAQQQYVSLQVDTEGDQRVLTLLNEDGSPIINAQVTLDGQYTRTTDGAGKVTFPVSIMPPGYHQLAILTADGRSLTQTILVT